MGFGASRLLAICQTPPTSRTKVVVVVALAAKLVTPRTVASAPPLPSLAAYPIWVPTLTGERLGQVEVASKRDTAVGA